MMMMMMVVMIIMMMMMMMMIIIIIIPCEQAINSLQKTAVLAASHIKMEVLRSES